MLFIYKWKIKLDFKIIYNRDYNASLNILKQGLNMADGTAVKKQVEVSSIEEPMKLEAQSSLEIV